MNDHAQSEFRHAYADVGGLRLHYVEAGQGPLVVLLHGFPEFWYSWRHQLTALAKAGYRAVAPDMRGYNLSDKPAHVDDYALDKLSSDVAALIDALGESKAFIVGHDWGGIVAWDFAMNYAGKLRGLVVMNLPHPARMLEGLRTLQQLKKSYYVFGFQIPSWPERLMARNDYELLKRTIAGGVRREHRTAADVDPYIEAIKKPGALTSAVNYYRAAVRHPGRYSTFHRIDQPVLVVWGERDAYLGAELAMPHPKWVPNARVEFLPEASHFVQVDAPERVNELLLGYLDERRRADA